VVGIRRHPIGTLVDRRRSARARSRSRKQIAPRVLPWNQAWPIPQVGIPISSAIQTDRRTAREECSEWYASTEVVSGTPDDRPVVVCG
jgi:hypothetical protein